MRTSHATSVSTAALAIGIGVGLAIGETDSVPDSRVPQVDPSPSRVGAEAIVAVGSHSFPERRDGAVRAPIPQAEDEWASLRSRVAELERKVASLESTTTVEAITSRIAATAVETPEGARNAVFSIAQERGARAAAQIPLRIAWLARWPTHPDAFDQLRALVDDYITTGRPGSAAAAVEQLAPTMELPGWRCDELRLRAAPNDEARVPIAERVARSSSEPEVREWAAYVLALSLANLQRRAEALVAIDSYLAHFSSSPGRTAELRRLRQRLIEGR